MDAWLLLLLLLLSTSPAAAHALAVRSTNPCSFLPMPAREDVNVVYITVMENLEVVMRVLHPLLLFALRKSPDVEIKSRSTVISTSSAEGP
jgi:hypothetical protein